LTTALPAGLSAVIAEVSSFLRCAARRTRCTKNVGSCSATRSKDGLVLVLVRAGLGDGVEQLVDGGREVAVPFLQLAGIRHGSLLRGSEG
jgi:hypothetical protein